jgi:hypothetical protein
MNKKLSTNGVLLALFLLYGLSASLFGETRSLNYQGFTEVGVASGMQVDITQSQTYSVRVTADPQLWEVLRVEQVGNRLEFRIESGWRRQGRGRAQIQITMPTLTALDLSGGSEGRISMNVSNDFSSDLSGGAHLTGSLNCGDMRINASGGSRATLAGTGGDLDLNGSGGSRVLFRDFSAQGLDATLSGGSTAVVTLNGVINANLSGGSEITFFGNANVGSTQASGGSRIKRGE